VLQPNRLIQLNLVEQNQLKTKF